MRVILLAILLSISHLAMAAKKVPTIYDSSVNWDDLAARTMLLQSSNTPKWDASAITSVYEMYVHPEQHNVPINKNDQKFNTAFLDEYFGPLTNPFVKYKRPAKVFVYLGENTITASYMAPIVKSETDGNYYVFNRANNKPQLLEDWINEIKSKSQPVPVKFTICKGYGNLPTDTCVGKSYQEEENFSMNEFMDMSNGNHMNVAAKSVSAYRAQNEDWRNLATNTIGSDNQKEMPDSILSTSVNWDDEVKRNALLHTTIAWVNYKTIQKNFEKLRDLRYFNDKYERGFMRRISWLYPDDGCWTRASAVINHLFGATGNSVNQFARPSKVFAFGNLCANTPNHPNGKVSWWYHTAPLIRDAQTNQTYVLDPSINPRKPITMEAWVAAISANTGACKNSYKPKVDKINVCTGFAAGPHESCVNGGANFSSEAMNALMQDHYQHLERDRQVELGRDVHKVLGDSPPWL